MGLLSRGGVGEFSLARFRLCVTRASVRYMCADCESHTRFLTRSSIIYWCVLSSHFRSPACNMSYMSVGLL